MVTRRCSPIHFSRRTIVLSACLMLLCSRASAAETKTVDLRTSPETLQAVQAALSNLKQGAAKTAVVDALKTALGLTAEESLTELRVASDSAGNSHTHFRRSFRGVPVWNEEIVVTQD